MTKNKTDNKCKKCGEEIASDISICPYCGYQVSGSFLTRKHSTGTLFAIFIVLFIFMGYLLSNNSSTSTNTRSNLTPTTQPFQQNIGRYAYNSNSGAYVGVVTDYLAKCSQEKLSQLDCYVIDQGELYNHKTIELPVEITDIKNVSPTTP